MVSNKYDVTIVGGGAMGLSTAYHLASTGKKVLVLEKYGFNNQNGSSAGDSRQFRLQYAQKYMSQLALDSVKYWDDLQKHSNEQLIDKTGSLWFGSPDISSQEGGINAAMQVMDELNISYEKLEAKQIEEKYHFKNLPSDYSGFFQKDGGIINLNATLSALFRFVDNAENIDLKEFSPVTDIQSNADGIIQVFANGTCYTTEKLIITAGAYVNDALQHLGLSVDINIWEMSSAYYKVEDPTVKYPTWFVFQEPQDTNLFYGFPEVDWSNPGYIRVAPDIPDRVIIDPVDRTGIPSQKSLRYNSDWVLKHMKGVSDKPAYESTCLIALSNNSKELLLDFAPDWLHNNKNIVVYTGGWAAKFIPLLGKMIADMAIEGATSYDISPFKISWPKVRGEYSKYFRTDKEDDLKLDVAIIGGGASGLYSGYRLLSGKDANGKPLGKKVNIFEMGERVGGRLESVKLPGMNVVGELGGMRYMTEQKIVTGLIEKVFATKYGLKSLPFPMGDPSHHLYYLRGQRFFASRFRQSKITGDGFKTRYFLDEKFEGLSSDEIFISIIDEVLKADGYSLEDIQNSEDPVRKWDEVKQKLTYRFDGPYKDMPVYKMGFWNLIKDRSSEECYTFLSQAGGYYSNTLNWNAAEAFPYMAGDFADAETVYKTIQGGFDQVLTCLASSFLELGGTIWTKNKLVRFDKNADSEYRYVLKMYNIESDSYYNVYAKDIILGMPRRSLQLLDQYNFFFDPDKQKELQHNLASVIIEPSFKILLGFEEPWWKKTLGAEAGESITDLPMRQCYYFGTDPENSHSLFLSSYNDMRTVAFWKTLEFGKPFGTRETRLVKGGNAEYPDTYDHATEAMVEEVMKQVRELHGDKIQVPVPYTSAYKDWTEDPFGGGYHAWKAVYKVWEVMPYVRQPMPEERIFIAGEAYSDQQGWVEGALCVTEHIMREKYGLSCPEWLDKDYYLGW
ncbi:FAD-dependent oxidoreductase [Cytophagaceae bacterium ABcell3]|nr:FAD-dependent oxidoreductase [Cytophagaceae bacterium ABcell3]